eukprot:g3023.t1
MRTKFEKLTVLLKTSLPVGGREEKWPVRFEERETVHHKVAIDERSSNRATGRFSVFCTQRAEYFLLAGVSMWFASDTRAFGYMAGWENYALGGACIGGSVLLIKGIKMLFKGEEKKDTSYADALIARYGGNRLIDPSKCKTAYEHIKAE